MRFISVSFLIAAFFAGGPDIALAASANMKLFAGYRVDALDWNIAGTFAGKNPNVLSELSWDDLRSFQVGVSGELAVPRRDNTEVVVHGRAAYGFILSGDNRDSDYAGDGRTLEWSRSDNDAGDGHLLNLEGGAGLRLSRPERSWSLMPQVGIAYFGQNLVMRDGVQTVSDDTVAPTGFTPPPLGPISGLNSSYDAWWYGPWIGLQVGGRSDDRLSWDLSLRWYKVDFRAEANWNLRSDLQHPVSFEHEADGSGTSLHAGFAYRINERWSAGGELEYFDLQADDGLDIVYLSSGAVTGTRLNDVNWESWALSVSMRYRFR